MINQAPASWQYDDSLEMLFLFYQCAEELLSEVTPDSYALPLHNSLTLLYEMAEVYGLLENYGIVDEYYKNYLPPIIEEFLKQTEDDYLLKQLLNVRLPAIRTGFREAEKLPQHLSAWISSVIQICTMQKYLSMYKEEIIRLVSSTKDKSKLLYCISNYFITLRWLGYSREHLYTTSKKYFDNHKFTIKKCEQIIEYFNLFPFEKRRFDFLILMDIDSIEYIDSISEGSLFGNHITKVDLSQETESLKKDHAASDLLKEYSVHMQNPGSHEKCAIIRYADDDYDPYSAAMKFNKIIEVLQSFVRYFKHFNYSKQVFKMLLKADNGHYREIKFPNKLQKRPFIEQSIIDTRIRNIITSKSMAQSAFMSISHAIEMHAEAFDSRSTSTLLKTFWTALETLFSEPNPASTRENVIKSVLPIIQKTYILKKLRSLYAQLVDAVSGDALSSIGITDFHSFLEYFSSYQANSSEMKEIYSLLKSNPLLRTRLFSTRNALNSGDSIRKALDAHQCRIDWQLQRLYRIRNIATHLGEEITGTEVAVNHLHNYFDFIVNYILCKSENNDFVVSTSAVVFEAKNDNRIYYERLKKNELLSVSNYKDLLFGPDQHLMFYQFEHGSNLITP